MKILIGILLLGMQFSVNAQQDRKVLATSGRVAKNLTPSLFQTRRIEYTLGEPLTFTTLANGKRINCGFIQPDANQPILNPNGGASAASALSAVIFPNPTDHYVSIQTNFAPDQHFNIQLIDLNGKLISVYQMSSNQLRINELILPSGLYLLNFYDPHGKFLLQKELSIY
ncbi:MAG: T9SS type A sorting domain-containing protein [Flavobacteriales bacterium]